MDVAKKRTKSRTMIPMRMAFALAVLVALVQLRTGFQLTSSQDALRRSVTDSSGGSRARDELLSGKVNNKGDASGNISRRSLGLQGSIENMFTADSNVTLTYSGRKDRMGCRIQSTLGVWAISRLKGWNFCSPQDEPMAIALGFPPCKDGSLRGRQVVDDYFGANVFNNATKIQSGYYRINKSWQQLLNVHSAWNQKMAGYFRTLIEKAPLPQNISSPLSKMLWVDDAAVHVAVHVRRGDLFPHWSQFDWIGDDEVLQLIEWSKRYALRRSDRVEIHLFSEDYGIVDWTRYEHIVDKFHLAPKMEKGSSDISLNIRDWKHFASADLLIVGGTFSGAAAMA